MTMMRLNGRQVLALALAAGLLLLAVLVGDAGASEMLDGLLEEVAEQQAASEAAQAEAERLIGVWSVFARYWVLGSLVLAFACLAFGFAGRRR